MYSNLLFFCFISIAASIPLKVASDGVVSSACTATRINITVFDNSKVVLNYSAILSTKPVHGSKMTDVFITDMVVASTDSSLYGIGGMFPSITADYGSTQNCSDSCHYRVGNSSVAINFPFSIKSVTSYVTLLTNVIDEGAISSTTGSMLPASAACQTIQDETSAFPGVEFTIRQCCIKNAPVKTVSTPSPMCQKFNASVVFYRNFNQFANIFVDMTYSSSDFSAAVMDSGSDFIDYFNFEMNGGTYSCKGPAGTQQHCLNMVTFGDFKALFQMTVSTSIPKKGLYTANVGRLINRNNTPLMEEGVSFTKQNPCSYMSNSFDNQSVTVTSQFCCDQFSS